MNKDNVRKLLNNCSKKELIELIFEIQKYSRSEFALNEFISLKTGFWHCNASRDNKWAAGDTFGGNV